jgi:hypothetical protein
MVNYSSGSNPHASEKRHGRVEIHYLEDSGNHKKHGSGADSGPTFNW